LLRFSSRHFFTNQNFFHCAFSKERIFNSKNNIEQKNEKNAELQGEERKAMEVARIQGQIIDSAKSGQRRKSFKVVQRGINGNSFFMFGCVMFHLMLALLRNISFNTVLSMVSIKGSDLFK